MAKLSFVKAPGGDIGLVVAEFPPLDRLHSNSTVDQPMMASCGRVLVRQGSMAMQSHFSHAIALPLEDKVELLEQGSGDLEDSFPSQSLSNEFAISWKSLVQNR